VVQETATPCQPSPCGANAVCREQNGAGSCSCLSEYIGNPYEGCRPECVLNTDCAPNRACIRNKCQDPCPGTCGQNADCQVVNHLPSCTCRPGHTGDPFRFCNVIPQRRKNHSSTACLLPPPFPPTPSKPPVEKRSTHPSDAHTNLPDVTIHHIINLTTLLSYLSLSLFNLSVLLVFDGPFDASSACRSSPNRPLQPVALWA